jgi:hypothetical protein
MGFHKKLQGLDLLPEVLKIKNTLLEMKFDLYWIDDSGLRMQKYFTEVHVIPENERLRILVHDDGLVLDETEEIAKIVARIALEFGYRQGANLVDPHDNSMYESDDEYYKYF